jgi:hypothetical protein
VGKRGLGKRKIHSSGYVRIRGEKVRGEGKTSPIMAAGEEPPDQLVRPRRDLEEGREGWGREG